MLKRIVLILSLINMMNLVLDYLHHDQHIWHIRTYSPIHTMVHFLSNVSSHVRTQEPMRDACSFDGWDCSHMARTNKLTFEIRTWMSNYMLLKSWERGGIHFIDHTILCVVLNTYMRIYFPQCIVVVHIVFSCRWHVKWVLCLQCMHVILSY